MSTPQGFGGAGQIARSGQLEGVSVVLARRAIEKADVTVLVIDSSQGVADQDATIAGEAEKAGSGIIIAANKWDLMKGQGQDLYKKFDDELRRQIKFLDYAPVLHISAATGERTDQVARDDRQGGGRAPEARADRRAQPLSEGRDRRAPPVSPGKKHVRILYAAQTSVAPPTFVFFTNVATEFHFSYERFLANQLRESFGLMGTPIRVKVRKS